MGPRYTICVNMEILGRIVREISREQAEICENRTFYFPNDLEGQGRWTPFKIASEIHILWKYRVPSSNPCRVIEGTSQILRKIHHFKSLNYLEDRSTPFSISSERSPRYTFFENIAFLARFPVELARGQAQFCGKHFTLSPNLPWRLRSIGPIFNGVREVPKIHNLWKFRVPSSNPCRVIVRTTSSHGRTDGRLQ